MRWSGFCALRRSTARSAVPFVASAGSSSTVSVPHSRPPPQGRHATAGTGASATAVVVVATVVVGLVLEGAATVEDGAPDTGGRRSVSSGRRSLHATRRVAATTTLATHRRTRAMLRPPGRRAPATAPPAVGRIAARRSLREHMRMGPHSFMPRDREAVKDTTFDSRVIRRAWTFARPFRWAIFGFLASIVVDAVIALLPPLIFRQIIDTAIPAGDKRQIWLLAGLAVGVAIGDAGLAIVQRWYSARIGEGLIYELRVALFDKVQQMPVAFFTRTQTGALLSRLNNDVVGAQNAVTSTLGSVVSNVIVLATTLPLMLFLEWRLTILTLIVLPLFIFPAKRVGRKLAAIAREQMNLNSSLNTQMTERFNVAGATLVKLFGRTDDEHRDFSDRASKVRDMGIRSAMYGRVFFVALGIVAALGAAMIYGVGGQMVIAGSIQVGTLVAMAAYTARIYQPLTGLTNARVDLMSSLVSFERVFEVLDAPVAIVDKPTAVDLVRPQGRIE